jgi:hypothetical protein
MVLYIVSYKNAEIVEKAVDDNKQAVLERKVDNNFCLSTFIKQQLTDFQPIDTLIIDLSALENADEEIINALSTFRMLYDKAKIIFIAEAREEGDPLLSEVFNMGIYNILAGNMDTDRLYDELNYCLSKGKTYRESLVFKNKQEVKVADQPIHKEKIIIKSEIKPAVNKTFIGFSGTQHRIGVTHFSIVCANYLKNQGFKVALIELNNSCFRHIKEAFDAESGNEYFKINQVDYYPDFNFDNITTVLNKKYNFVLIDFGLYTPDNAIEFNRCAIPIILTGSKPWETEYLNNIFERVPEADLFEYSFVFNFTSDKEFDEIKKEMEPLNKIFFAEYNPDPFNPDKTNCLKQIFKGYIPETITNEKNFDIKEQIKKWGSFLLKSKK